jgi:hypothetical protein
VLAKFVTWRQFRVEIGEKKQRKYLFATYSSW